MGSDKHLKLRATPKSALGRVITHLQNDLTNQQDLAAATLLARFLPFAMEQDDPQFRSVAIRCANDCEAWAKAIREYAGGATSSSFLSMEMGQSSHSTHNSLPNLDEVDDEFESSSELDPEIDERKEQRRNNSMGF